MLTIIWNLNKMSGFNAKNSKEVFPTKTMAGAIKVLGKRQTANIQSASLFFKGVVRNKTYQLVQDGKNVEPENQLVKDPFWD